MSTSGYIKYVEHNGAYILKLVGDVRLDLCTTLDAFIKGMFASTGFVSVMIDLCEAEGLDSTTLGLLAKISIESQKQGFDRPIIFCTNQDLLRLLDSMSFSDVFNIQSIALQDLSQLDYLPECSGDECEIRDKVIEAHKILANLSRENELKFKNLLEALSNS